jgi:DNA-binding protein Fis
MTGIAAVIEKMVKEYFSTQGDNITDSSLYDTVLHEVERPLLAQTLHAVKGNKAKAARVLGINRNTLHKKLSEHGL